MKILKVAQEEPHKDQTVVICFKCPETGIYIDGFKYDRGDGEVSKYIDIYNVYFQDGSYWGDSENYWGAVAIAKEVGAHKIPRMGERVS